MRERVFHCLFSAFCSRVSVRPQEEEHSGAILIALTLCLEAVVVDGQEGEREGVDVEKP